MFVKISVTEKDIAKGRRDDCVACPIALAIKRTLPNVEQINVTASNFSLIGRDKRGTRCYEGGFLPFAVRFFIIRFDNGRTVQPFEFEIEVDECFALTN